jgi:hypothetical protein
VVCRLYAVDLALELGLDMPENGSSTVSALLIVNGSFTVDCTSGAGIGSSAGHLVILDGTFTVSAQTGSGYSTILSFIRVC